MSPQFDVFCTTALVAAAPAASDLHDDDCLHRYEAGCHLLSRDLAKLECSSARTVSTSVLEEILSGHVKKLSSSSDTIVKAPTLMWLGLASPSLVLPSFPFSPRLMTLNSASSLFVRCFQAPMDYLITTRFYCVL
ncbi:Hypothetical protein, putative [Bodo saltans]|uniref:Uncharacterized protein n=1 Tax=Bodo saltans TaxID=75058 RepID=A0A0S4IY75_BODSA|nr:Hypothetical protein, putative [Bodo saltans]|eukprot:CUG06089.1 Hypothetical protein, putative [Bodo saltans]